MTWHYRERGACGTDHGLAPGAEGAICQTPRDADDLVLLLRRLAKSGTDACLRGGGCSTSGRSIAAGTQVRMRHLDGCRIEGQRLIAGGGATLASVLDTLQGQERWLPVVPSSPSATVGGVLAAGGLGPASLRRGGLFTCLEEVVLATPERGLVRAAPDCDPDGLFALIPGSLGSLGPIVEASFSLDADRPSLSMRESAETAPLRDIAQGLIEGDAEAALLVSSDLRNWRVQRFLPDRVGPRAGPDLHDHLQKREMSFQAAEAGWLARAGLALAGVRRIWADFILPLERIDDLRTALLRDRPGAGAFLAYNAMVFSAEATRRSARFPLSPLAGLGAMVSLGTYATLPLPMVDAFRRQIDALREKALQLGGRQYLHGAYPSTRGFVERQFGLPTVACLDGLRRTLGVDHVFAGL